MTDEMRRRWIIEVHRPGQPVAHVTTRGTDLDPVVSNDHVGVWDDVAQASSVLDAMQGSLDPSMVVYKLAPHHCWCAPTTEQPVVERYSAEARRVIADFQAARDDALSERDKLMKELSLARDQRDAACAELSETRGKRTKLSQRIAIVEDALREARAYESRLRAECNVLAARLDLSQEETHVTAAAKGVDPERYTDLYPKGGEGLRAKREAVDAAHAAYETARKSAPTPVDGPAVGSVRETYSTPETPITYLDRVRRERDDAQDAYESQKNVNKAQGAVLKQSVADRDAALAQLAEARSERDEAMKMSLRTADGVPNPDIEQHPLVLAAQRQDAARIEQIRHLAKERDDARAERDGLREDLSARIGTLSRLNSSLTQERDGLQRTVDGLQGNPEQLGDYVRERDELRAEVAKHTAALGLCDQWIQDRDKTIASLRAELDTAGMQVLALEGQLADAQAVSRGLVDELRRGAERPRLLSVLGRLGVPLFRTAGDERGAPARASDEAQAHARASRLLGELRAAQIERDALRSEAEALRSATLEAGLANYKEERPALYAEVGRLQGLVAEIERSTIGGGSYEPGQLLWTELEADRSTTTWSSTTADKKRYASAERVIRTWGFYDLRAEIADLSKQLGERAAEVSHLLDADDLSPRAAEGIQLRAELLRVSRALAQRDEEIVALKAGTSAAVVTTGDTLARPYTEINRQPLMSEVEAGLRAEIERLRGVILERTSATATEASRH